MGGGARGLSVCAQGAREALRGELAEWTWPGHRASSAVFSVFGRTVTLRAVQNPLYPPTREISSPSL